MTEIDRLKEELKQRDIIQSKTIVMLSQTHEERLMYYKKRIDKELKEIRQLIEIHRGGENGKVD